MSLTRAELTERLKKLAESEPPKEEDLAEGAFCYAPATPQTCPKCGNIEYYGQVTALAIKNSPFF